MHSDKEAPIHTISSVAEQSVDAQRYQAITATIYFDISHYDVPLRDNALDSFAKLATYEFSRLVALLPFWLSDLVPVSPDIALQLGVANLYGWQYYSVQDDLLDGSAIVADLPSAQLALLKMVEIYRMLGVTEAPCWSEFQRFAAQSAAAHARELHAHFDRISGLTPDGLMQFTIAWIIERAAPFFFSTLAQLHLAGIAPEQPISRDLIAALHCFAAARQIGDDASDWLDDLRGGRINYVSAQLMSYLYANGKIKPGDELDLERLAGLQLHNEDFWSSIERTHRDLQQQALDHLAPYDSSRFSDLIEQHMARDAQMWAEERERRASMRSLFGMQPGI